MRTTKMCPHCGKVKPRDEFYPAPKRNSGLRSWCKDCGREASRLSRGKWQRQNPIEHKIAVARSRWRNNSRIVQVRSEDGLRCALKDPYPFYAEQS